MNERGMYGTVKTFGGGMLTGAAVVGVAALLVRHAIKRQQQYVAEINRYRPRRFA